MGPISLRSLLVAVVVISDCITWTASRHHYTHNVSGHRSRHRRQGAGLYLPASYVVPGGEGGGAWGEWGDVSPCSRTCGGGVASQKRICLEIGPDGRPLCSGGDTKYFSCQTQDCPDGSKDFRAEQCSEHDKDVFRGIRYKWVPYTKAPNPCELNCMPKGERFYYRHKSKVTDGTRCNDESFDVCVDGTCQPVGCDMMLGSNAREDKCRVCRGNNTNCHTVNGNIPPDQELRQGYNDVLLIPEGATSIIIAEVRDSNNYLALRSKQYGKYYLNGDYHIDFPRTLLIAGALWHYERSQQGFAAPDKLRCQGPTNETLYLSLLLQDVNVGIDYEYSIPSSLAPPPNQQYNWVHGDFTPCSVTCGGGFQTRTVTCRSREDLEEVDEGLCDEGLKPPTNQTCSTNPCAARWVEGPWSPCSRPCGEGGTRSRQVHCEKVITNGLASIVTDHECFELLGKKPELYQECNKEAACPQWFTGPWKPCDKLCGEGKQTRQVVCYQKNEKGRIEVLPDSDCADEKPSNEQSCVLHPCDGVDWVLSEWSGCDSCLSTVRSRTARCVTKDEKIVNDSFCAYHPAPVLEEPCDRTKLPACEVQWYATQWSNCSVQCGKGVQTRRIFCGLFDGASVLKVDDERCNKDEKYNDTKTCEILPEKCPAKWYAAPWSECTKMCGGGEQYRRVMCLIGQEPSTACDGDIFPDTTQSCNTGPCDKDEMLPVDAGSTPVMDDDYDEEECESDEDYGEEGLDEGEKTGEGEEETEATMSSDDPSVYEGSGSTTAALDIESEFTPSEGSGWEPTGSTTSDGSTEASGETELIWSSSESSTTDLTEESSESGATTESALTSESDLTGSTDTSGTSESSITDTSETGATSENGDTSETGVTSESGVTSDTTESSDTSESSGTDSTTDSDVTSESSITETSDTSDSSTDSSSTPLIDSTSVSTDSSTTASSDISSTTEDLISTTESGTTDFSTTDSSTTVSGDTESSSNAGTEDTTESGVTTDSSGASDTDGTTVSGETTEFGSTGTSESEGSTTEGSTESTGSTETEITESTVSGETSESGATTESGATSESEATDATESEGTTESGATTETGSTESEATSESGATDVTESTLETSSTTDMSEGSTETTEWSWTSTIDLYTTTKRPRCKVRRKSKCRKSKFGCCPDMRTPAAGPFDEGCPNPKTCKESIHGCCPDEVSAAAGPHNEGCPSVACNETLFGCCKSDNKTPAAGNDQEGCPPPPPACKSSKFGCCKDGKTKAKGPHRKGCPEKEPPRKESTKTTTESGPEKEGPCDTSEFGCCPDGVSPARGTQMEGCIMSCNTSAYGCCPDGETPAHGPEYEGCCLLYAYGCCPDNYRPAEGPHLEGCGCQYAHYGCCPDNVTIARGPNNAGCGCQYTDHGCCPDRHTEASGPEYEGCGCHTYQFGCCPDGTTIAKGPNLQGCHCQQSKYGCCGDGQTPASGPDQAGCDCSSSKYGCCPDGQTEAKGEKFLGCTDVPENRQAACSLATDRGPCRNYTAYWFYDIEYGGCSRFWYGGCEGNGNRFSSKEECEDVCVHPSPKDACKLPKVKGACQGYHLRWYFDSAREQCSQFVFGGCLGNANNFDSRDLCQEQCEPARSEDQCQLPIDGGSCAGNFGRWGFNAETHRCEQFIWGGCEGNANRFGSEAACVMRCDPPGALKSECSLPQEPGNCTEKLAMWAFSQPENRCVPFYYTGCNGNGNRFNTEQSCMQACPSVYVQDVCTLPALTGECADYRERWYYDTVQKRCRQFYYGGCGGNSNNFATELECENRCKEDTKVTTTTTPPQEPEPFRQEFCFLEKDPGPCSQSEARWGYDASLGSCTSFQYGGCGGNRNNFPSREYCEYYCTPTQDICQLPMRAGPCDASVMRYFYDPITDSCSQFTYGGCDGNGNNFESLEDCERRCRSSQPAATTTVAPVIEPQPGVPRECLITTQLEQCARAGDVWYYDARRRACSPHRNGDSGPYCRHTGTFPTEEHCRRACVPQTSGLHPCQQPVATGNCLESEDKWFYDEYTDSCSQFIYTGCDGNDNRFDSQQQCEAQCRRQPPQTTTTTTQEPESREPVPAQCRTPHSLQPCGGNMTVFYYDEASSSCRAAEFGGCRYANSYRSEEECERQCGAFRGFEVCTWPLDTGSCNQGIPKVYYNAVTGTCEPYAYGGCHGGPNRFSTIDECEEVCGAISPDVNTNEVLPDCSRFAEECHSIQCPFSVQRTRTADGCERCSCVPVEIDCEPLTQECQQLKCTYGMERTTGDDGCERCRCIDHPCAGKDCPSGERCVAHAYRDPITQDARYNAECRTINKGGSCPAQAPAESEASCRRECNDDADCESLAKCCQHGCSALCLTPAAPSSPRPLPTTPSPELPQAPQANPQTEPEVTAAEGGKATLRCLFHGNPPPKITWRRGEITIDGTVGRYRLMSDGALEIVSLYRNDSGVYICVAENGLGTARQEIHLQVNDPVETPAGISGESDTVVTGELGRPVTLRCLAYGYPAPDIYWYRGLTGPMVPFSSTLYEARGNTLLIRVLNVTTLGEYTCQAFNGKGKPASWSIMVQAYREGDSWPEEPNLVPRERTVLVTPRTEPPTEPPAPDFEVPYYNSYNVPVTTRMVVESSVVATGGELRVRCDVDGYPTPEVRWTKDGVRLTPSDRVAFTDTRLTIQSATPADSGEYGCHAANSFSSDQALATITVQGMVIPAKCVDNPLFANCKLIVLSKYCRHQYYSKFCCKSCVEAGQLNAADLELQADEAWRKK